METRLDRLWQCAAGAPEDEAAWLEFYEGLATARLYLALDGADGDRVRPTILPLEAGPTALAFDHEDRFSAAIGRPTDYAALTGAELAGLLAGEGVALALNPGVAPSETVIDPETLGWIAGTFAAAEIGDADGARLGPVHAPEPRLLDALGRRVADFGEALAEAWLVTLATRAGTELALVVRFGPAADTLADEIGAALTRTGQMSTDRPFAVAPAAEGSALLAAARRHGIGIGA